MAPDVAFHPELSLPRDAEHPSPVPSVHLPLLNRPLKRGVNPIRLCDQEQPTRVFVEAVDDAGSERPASGAERDSVGEQRLDECRSLGSRGRVHSEARGLVENQQMRILEDDGQWEGNRVEVMGRRVQKWSHRNDLTRLDSVTGLAFDAVDPHPSGPSVGRQPAAARLWEVPGQQLIQPLAPIGDEFHPGSGFCTSSREQAGARSASYSRPQR